MHTQFKIHDTQNVGSPVFLVMNVCSAGSCRTKKYEQCFKFFDQLQQSRVVLQGGMRHFVSMVSYICIEFVCKIAMKKM